MGCIAGEESIEKRQKIDNLRLSADEWKRIQIFEMLLDVSTHIIFIVPLDSDYQTADKAQWAFSSATVPLYVIQSQLSRNSMRPGRSNVIYLKQDHLKVPLMREWQRLMNTTRKQQNLMCILWSCVCKLLFICKYILTVNSSTSKTKDEVF